MILETDIWVLDMLIATGFTLLLGPLRWQSKEIYVGILAWVHTHIYKHLCDHVYLYWTRHEIILMFSTITHHSVDHSSLLPLLGCNLPLQQWKTWLLPSTIYLLDCLIPVYMYNSIRIVNSYTPHGKPLDQLEYSSIYSSFYL